MTRAFVPTVRRRGFALGAARSRIAMLLVVGGLLAPSVTVYGASRMFPMYGPDRIGNAENTVRMFAYQAFGTWKLSHLDRSCPEQLEELLEFVNRRDISDPWGRDYRFRCIPDNPMVVWSAGQDRRHGTDDDIWSDR